MFLKPSDPYPADCEEEKIYRFCCVWRNESTSRKFNQEKGVHSIEDAQGRKLLSQLTVTSFLEDLHCYNSFESFPVSRVDGHTQLGKYCDRILFYRTYVIVRTIKDLFASFPDSGFQISFLDFKKLFLIVLELAIHRIWGIEVHIYLLA